MTPFKNFIAALLSISLIADPHLSYAFALTSKTPLYQQIFNRQALQQPLLSPKQSTPSFGQLALKTGQITEIFTPTVYPLSIGGGSTDDAPPPGRGTITLRDGRKLGYYKHDSSQGPPVIYFPSFPSSS